MGRIRTIKPEFWRHEGLSALPEATHLLAAALLNYSDDEGYFNANLALIKAECSPLREPSVSIQCSLSELARIDFLKIGDAADWRRYGHIEKFVDHQRVNRPTPSKIRDLTIAWEDSLSPHPQLTEPSLLEGKGRERKGKEQGSAPEDQRVSLVEGLDQGAWERWVDYRSKLKKPIKPISIEEAQKELARYGPQQNEVVARSIAHGWQGLFPLDSRADGKPNDKPARNSPAQRAADAVLERERARRGGGGPTGVP